MEKLAKKTKCKAKLGDTHTRVYILCIQRPLKGSNESGLF